jgi:hypothetical protein
MNTVSNNIYFHKFSDTYVSYVLNDSNGDKYILLMIYKNTCVQPEIEKEIYDYRISPIKEINKLSSKLESVIEKSNRTMSMILQKADVSKSQKLIDEFLELDDSKKEIFLDKHSEQLLIAIHTTDLNRIIVKTNGNRLFHQLIASKSAKIQKLAMECILAGFPIDSPNDRGLTGLTIAVLKNDASLVRQLLEMGANPNCECDNPNYGPFTPKKLAANQEKHIIMLEFFTYEISQLNNNLDQILALWNAISTFKSQNKKNADILKTCDNLSLLVVKAFLSAIKNDYDLKKIFRDRDLVEDLICGCAYVGSDEIIKKNLNNDYLLQSLSESIEKGISRNFTEERDIKLLQFMFDTRLIFALIQQESGQSYIDILQTHPQINHLFATLTFLDDKTRSDCIYLSKLRWNTPKIRFEYYFDKQAEIELKITQLIERNHQLGCMFKNIFDSDLKEVNKHKEALSHYNGDSLKFLKYITRNQIELPYLSEYCISFKEFELLSEIYDGEIFGNSIEKFQARMFFHIFLDKLMIPNHHQSLEVFSTSCTVGGLIRAFKSLEKDLSPNSPIANIFPMVQREIVPLLQGTLACFGAQKKFWLHIQQMQTGEKLLIPTGFKGHITSLLLEKTSNETFRVTVYNTGVGVIKWHPRWFDSSRYQTYVVIDQVPVGSIMNKNHWDQLLLCRLHGTSNEFYEIIFDKIGAGGMKRLPSTHQEDYEAIQRSETCAMQVLLTTIRHMTMLITAGTHQEKEAVYKHLKFALQESWLNSQDPEHLQDVAQWIPQIKYKLAIEKQVCDLAIDIDASDKALNECQSLLRLAGHDEAAETLKREDAISCFGRYALQRTAAGLLFNAWAKEPLETSLTSTTTNNPIIKLGLTKLDARKLLNLNFFESLNHAESKNNFYLWLDKFVIYIIYTDSLFGIKEFVKRVNSDTAKNKFTISDEPVSAEYAVEHLVRQLKIYPKDFIGPLVESLCQQLRSTNLDHLAETALKIFNTQELQTSKAAPLYHVL